MQFTNAYYLLALVDFHSVLFTQVGGGVHSTLLRPRKVSARVDTTFVGISLPILITHDFVM